ncbi:MAG TPA: PadR family transcriptional regulator [Gemmatimonadaceae bacterium]|nr:PadR family transcriptional regulator [Gemmatimonadaceae bacterium]
MPTDLMQGTLDMLILKALSWDDLHGYAVARWIERTADDTLRIEEGSLYPALHRLTGRGWVNAEWGVSENNRRARYYSLTAEGRKQLRRETAEWSRFIAAVGKVLQSQPA